MRVRRLADTERIRERQALVAQEWETRPQPRFKGFQNPGWIDRNSSDFAVGNVCSFLELNQFLQLDLSLRSPGSAKEHENKRLVVSNLLDRDFLPSIVDQTDRWEDLTF